MPAQMIDTFGIQDFSFKENAAIFKMTGRRKIHLFSQLCVQHEKKFSFVEKVILSGFNVYEESILCI